MARRILLVEPAFPIPAKSKNHKNILPIGLLKIATYLEKQNVSVELVRGLVSKEELGTDKRSRPDEIWITSLFTYWSSYVTDAVKHYRQIYPDAKINVGGIFASLFPKKEVRRITGCDAVTQGVIAGVEKCAPAYSLVESHNGEPIDYQIVHASRGCSRKCRFCGTWVIEPKFIPKRTIADEITHKKVVFYDNNFLMNPFISDILDELADFRMQGLITWCESQSGFDGRVLLQKPVLAKKIREAGFRNPRVAWDWGYAESERIEIQISILEDVGYKAKDIFVFMLYNLDTAFEEMEMKRKKCWEWKVQISDCRYRPLDQLSDNYNPLNWEQTSNDYYIHEKSGWTDDKVKQFRRNVRQQNICVRQGVPFYSHDLERKSIGDGVLDNLKTARSKKDKIRILKLSGIDFWFPDEDH